MRLLSVVIASAAILLASLAIAAETGNLKLDVLGEFGAGALNRAEVIAAGGAKVAEVAPGASVALKPGEYRVVLPIVGGKITRENVKVEAGRTTTVMITNVAVLGVTVRDRSGKDPGLPVTVSGAEPPHDKLLTMITGDLVLMAPNAVDVKVQAPPQGYNWHAVELTPGRRTILTLNEMVKADLVVQPTLAGAAMDKSTRVVVYKAGTQDQVAVSAPGLEHRFSLEPGDYDVFVENDSGKGAPYAMEHGVHLDSGANVTRQVALDDRKASDGK